MPLTVPAIDARSYEELRDEALRRIPVHNPAWTNFNASDPGVTLVELFAFMTESLLYRANQIPERNRRAFLSLLGMRLLPAASAQGLVAIANERGPLETLTLGRGVEVRAGEVPFRTDEGLDVLPVEGRVYAKRRANPRPEVVEQYRQLYASFGAPGGPPPDVTLYDTVVLTPDAGPIDLVRDTIDASLWVALLVRPTDKPLDTPPGAAVVLARKAIGGKVLSLGIVPVVDTAGAHAGPTAREGRQANHLAYRVPSAGSGVLPASLADRRPSYTTLDPVTGRNVLLEPGVVQLTLPPATALGLWTNLEPLEAGVGDFPPFVDDTAVSDRVVTWIRVQATSAQPARVEWCEINAVRVTQRVPVVDEILPPGTGDPDQVARLGRRPVVPGSVRLTLTTAEGRTMTWTEVDDLAVAGPEVTFRDPALPPGARPSRRGPSEAFAVDAEAGELRFGDGEHGARPARDAVLRVDYDVSDGAAGNVGPQAIATGPTLPPGVRVLNRVRTWGGVDTEPVAAAERRVTRHLRHGDRLVTAEDHRAIAQATPEVEVGRVEVLPAFDPRLSPSDPGDAPGAVTLLAIPRYDLVNPDTPDADGYFLDAICHYLDPRRLVTSELFLRGPVYRPVLVSVGIDVVGDRSVAATREAVRRALTAFLAPLPRDPSSLLPPYHHQAGGWPLFAEIRRLELLAYVARVDGVRQVRGLLLSAADGSAVETVGMRALELPRLAGLSVVVGDPLALDQLRGTPGAPPPDRLPVPAPPESC
jgi:hypothetical protein